MIDRQISKKAYQAPIYTINCGCAQSIGKLREHNEDSLLNFSSIYMEEEACKLFSIFAVADGMGGHQYGEIASRLAIHEITRYIFSNIYLPLISKTIKLEEIKPANMFNNAYKIANQKILENAPGSGTTLSVVTILDQQLIVTHVGDSRIYYIDESGIINLLTRDHSLVNHLIELGQITQEQATFHPQRNILYRALGQTEPFKPDIYIINTPASGYLLLCTDGLWGSVGERKMVNIIMNGTSVQNISERLVEEANQSGGPDNISVILARFENTKNLTSS